MTAEQQPNDLPENETPADDAAEAPPEAPNDAAPAGDPPIPSFERDDADDTAESAAAADDAERVVSLEAEVADLKDRMLRAVAEQENVRRRAGKDVENATRRTVKAFAGDLLAVADNLRRALDSIDESTRKENPALENVLIGVEMTERELMNAFGRHGITRMEPVGQRFDPNFHEAMFEYEDADQPAGTVGQVIETGYLIQGQALRAAKVGVTKGGPKPEPAPVGEPVETAVEPAAPKDGDTAAEPGSRVDESL